MVTEHPFPAMNIPAEGKGKPKPKVQQQRAARPVNPNKRAQVVRTSLTTDSSNATRPVKKAKRVEAPQKVDSSPKKYWGK